VCHLCDADSIVPATNTPHRHTCHEARATRARSRNLCQPPRHTRGVGHATYLTVTSDPHDIVSKVGSSERAPVPSHTLTTRPHIIGETFESPQRRRDDPPDAHAIGGHQPGPHRAPHAAYNGEEVHPLC
jgi:hypothetical protein